MIPAFDLALPAQVRFGRGGSETAAQAILDLGRRVLLVRGRNRSRVLGMIGRLADAGAEITEHACPCEPTLDMLDDAVAAARGVDVVVAFGGGSAIDLGKAAAALARAPGGALDHLEVVGKGLPLVAPPLPFVAVPTTAGTGAEATTNAVIDVPAHRRKVSLRDRRMLARLAIVDPALTDGCPSSRDACLGP